MMFYEFTAGNKSYKLRLTTRNIVALEKQIGCNPLMIFGNGDRVPTVMEMVNILHQSLQAYEHGIGINEAYDVFDAFLADEHQVTDFIPVILEIYKVSGILKNGDKEKN